MPDRRTVESFAARVEAGDYLGAIRDFYAPDATMRENAQAPRAGRDVLVEHERQIGSSRSGSSTIRGR
jgi:ketosteroid isomerase-like protein